MLGAGVRAYAASTAVGARREIGDHRTPFSIRQMNPQKPRLSVRPTHNTTSRAHG
jgi:hypothetical protein